MVVGWVWELCNAGSAARGVVENRVVVCYRHTESKNSVRISRVLLLLPATLSLLKRYCGVEIGSGTGQHLCAV